MIRVTILYPKTPGSRFDFDYYVSTHMPLSIARIGHAMRFVSVERGLDPGAPWPPQSFHALCHFVCDSKEAFESAFLPHAAELQGDTPNYTDVEAIISMSSIELQR